MIPSISQSERDASNLAALRYKDNNITKIVCIAKHSQFYYYNTNSKGHPFESAPFNGSLFLVQRRKFPSYQLILLNKASPDDLNKPITRDTEIEMKQDHFLYIRNGDNLNTFYIVEAEECLAMFKALEEIIRSMRTVKHAPVALKTTKRVGEAENKVGTIVTALQHNLADLQRVCDQASDPTQTALVSEATTAVTRVIQYLTEKRQREEQARQAAARAERERIEAERARAAAQKAAKLAEKQAQKERERALQRQREEERRAKEQQRLRKQAEAAAVASVADQRSQVLGQLDSIILGLDVAPNDASCGYISVDGVQGRGDDVSAQGTPLSLELGPVHKPIPPLTTQSSTLQQILSSLQNPATAAPHLFASASAATAAPTSAAATVSTSAPANTAAAPATRSSAATSTAYTPAAMTGTAMTGTGATGTPISLDALFITAPTPAPTRASAPAPASASASVSAHSTPTPGVHTPVPTAATASTSTSAVASPPYPTQSHGSPAPSAALPPVPTTPLPATPSLPRQPTAAPPAASSSSSSSSTGTAVPLQLQMLLNAAYSAAHLPSHAEAVSASLPAFPAPTAALTQSQAVDHLAATRAALSASAYHQPALPAATAPLAISAPVTASTSSPVPAPAAPAPAPATASRVVDPSSLFITSATSVPPAYLLSTHAAPSATASTPAGPAHLPLPALPSTLSTSSQTHGLPIYPVPPPSSALTTASTSTSASTPAGVQKVDLAMLFGQR